MHVVVCGEALIDLIPDNSVPGTTQSSLWQAHSAGGPLNTAVALARLGLPAQFLGRLGGDGFGAQLRSHLAVNDVGLDLAVQTESEPTSLAIVSVDSTGQATYTFHLRGTANFNWAPQEFPELGADDWLHTGSLMAVVEPGRSALLDYLSTTPAGLSFDLNVRPTVQPDRRLYGELLDPFLKVLGERGGVVRASDEDLHWLDPSSGSSARRIAADLAATYGLELVVVTTGGEGAFAVGANREPVSVPGLPTAVADTVGAGDTFTAGFLKVWLEEKNLVGAMRSGCAAASIVCSRIGANPPDADEVAALLARA
ncbi:carbohydrate kinase [uncultured Propionibacterium sp.]|uniref:carbohydrate kinase family protein n=1 Tax=uncultured Propionibacterium sp. TaxID=218066 RepID=UPI002931246F|nr:carbohydrate kinase [uncultured Propionibacterium sp.]